MKLVLALGLVYILDDEPRTTVILSSVVTPVVPSTIPKKKEKKGFQNRSDINTKPEDNLRPGI